MQKNNKQKQSDEME
jgi:hypothetical protein